jgi:ribosome-associated toxin RatA of RatAB toxin-antitoxin module
VLTDYENIEDFVSSVVSSRVAERNKGGALIEQVSIGKVLFFSKRVSLRLRLQETPLNEVTFKEMSRKDFEFYEGRWSLQEMPAGCRVIYNLKARPKFLVPLWLARNAFRSSGQDLLTEIKDEILRRADASTIKPLNPARDLVADFKNSESL